MRKTICDFCEKNEAVHRYLVKKLETIECPFGETDKNIWIPKDICDECYNKLFKGDKNGIR